MATNPNTAPSRRPIRCYTLGIATKPAVAKMASKVAKARGQTVSELVEGLILAEVRNHVIKGGE